MRPPGIEPGHPAWGAGILNHPIPTAECEKRQENAINGVLGYTTKMTSKGDNGWIVFIITIKKTSGLKQKMGQVKGESMDKTKCSTNG